VPPQHIAKPGHELVALRLAAARPAQGTGARCTAARYAPARNANQRERAEHRDKRDGVDDEHPAGTDDGDEHARDRRPDEPGRVEGGRVERHRVRKLLGPDEVRDEGLARRRVEGVHNAEREREAVQVPELRMAEHEQEAEARGEQHQKALRDEEHPPPIEAIGNGPAERHEQQLRAKLQRHGHADRDGVIVAQLGEYHPVLRRGLHPRTDVRHERPEEPDAVVSYSKRPEHR